MSSPMPFIPPSEKGAMCCICFDWRPVHELYRDIDGQVWDLCALRFNDCALKAGEEDLA